MQAVSGVEMRWVSPNKSAKACIGCKPECLITDDPTRALNIAQQLDALNRERREIESGIGS